MNKDKLLKLLSEHKAVDIVSFDLFNKSSLADAMIIASGNSSRHVLALSDYLLKYVKELGVKNIQIEGADSGEWVLIDIGDYLIHLFCAEAREFYDLDSLWSEITPKIVHIEDELNKG
ncbi:MAG: ribosome silencing factor [Alphaproteobacteria bacterium]|nr:ribosome silencing factor [Alphaproteobacteria bacterium]